MSTNKVNTDLAAMHVAANKVANDHEDMRNILHQLQNDANGVETGWRGQASQTFIGVMEDIKNTSQQMLTTLQGMGENIKTNMVKYNDTDSQFQSALNKFSSLGNLNT